MNATGSWMPRSSATIVRSQRQRRLKQKNKMKNENKKKTNNVMETLMRTLVCARKHIKYKIYILMKWNGISHGCVFVRDRADSFSKVATPNWIVLCTSSIVCLCHLAENSNGIAHTHTHSAVSDFWSDDRQATTMAIVLMAVTATMVLCYLGRQSERW